MSEASPAFSLYGREFLVGTVTMSLTERGALVTLLCYQWAHGSVPSDHATLARICGCSRGEMAKVWVTIGLKFPRGADGLCRNARLEVERTKQAHRRAALTANGKKGGRPPGTTYDFADRKAKGNQ